MVLNTDDAKGVIQYLSAYKDHAAGINIIEYLFPNVDVQELDNQWSTVFDVSNERITLKNTLLLCDKYLSRSSCDGSNCGGVHICKNYAFGSCRLGDNCDNGHFFKTKHNVKVLSAFLMEDLESPALTELIKKSNKPPQSSQSTPALFICAYYNMHGCRKEGFGTCQGLHICRQRIVGNCSGFPNCRLNHSLTSSDCAVVLDTHGISVTEMSPKEIIAYIKNSMNTQGKPSVGDNGPRMGQRVGRLNSESDKGIHTGGLSRGDNSSHINNPRSFRSAEVNFGRMDDDRSDTRSTHSNSHPNSWNNQGRDQRAGWGRHPSGGREGNYHSRRVDHGASRFSALSNSSDAPGPKTAYVPPSLRQRQSSGTLISSAPVSARRVSADTSFKEALVSSSTLDNQNSGGSSDQPRQPSSSQRPDDHNQPKRSHHALFNEDGSVKLPEICPKFMDGICDADHLNKVCDRLHVNSTYFWQVSQDGKMWLNFPQSQSEAVESAYCDPKVSTFTLPDLDPTKLSIHTQLLALIGSGGLSWTADFAQMKLIGVLNLDLRRLALPPLDKRETKWAWYWKDEMGNWVEYGGLNPKGDLKSSLTSDEIETSYNFGIDLTFSNVMFSYSIDFDTMTQKNTSTQVEREIRRRPMCHGMTAASIDFSGAQSLPANWAPMSDSSYKKVLIDSTNSEYREVVRQFSQTASCTIVKIYRIQNTDKWQQYQLKKAEMAKKYKTTLDKVDERLLFHGTIPEAVDSICQQNFDWRLYGSAVGSFYGCGIYFSNLASLSADYAKRSALTAIRFMFLARVLVGQCQKGSNGQRRPDPINPSDPNVLYDTTVDSISNPTKFVKYYDGEYYPEYLIEFQ